MKTYKCKSCNLEKAGDGVMCEYCGCMFFICNDCIRDKMGCNCPECGEFCVVFDDDF